MLCQFQVYSKVNQVHTHTHIFFRFFSIIGHYKILSMVPCAIAGPCLFYIQCVSVYYIYGVYLLICVSVNIQCISVYYIYGVYLLICIFVNIQCVSVNLQTPNLSLPLFLFSSYSSCSPPLLCIPVGQIPSYRIRILQIPSYRIRIFTHESFSTCCSFHLEYLPQHAILANPAPSAKNQLIGHLIPVVSTLTQGIFFPRAY